MLTTWQLKESLSTLTKGVSWVLRFFKLKNSTLLPEEQQFCQHPPHSRSSNGIWFSLPGGQWSWQRWGACKTSQAGLAWASFPAWEEMMQSDPWKGKSSKLFHHGASLAYSLSNSLYFDLGWIILNLRWIETFPCWSDVKSAWRTFSWIYMFHFVKSWVWKRTLPSWSSLGPAWRLLSGFWESPKLMCSQYNRWILEQFEKPFHNEHH